MIDFWTHHLSGWHNLDDVDDLCLSLHRHIFNRLKMNLGTCAEPLDIETKAHS